MKPAAIVASGIALMLLVAAGPPEGPARVRPVTVGMGLPMPLLKADEASITVRLPATTTGGGGEEMTLAIDKEKTRVFVGVVADRKETPDGKVTMRVERRPGTVADLKVGQQVRVTAVEGHAATIDIMPPSEKKRRKKPDAPAKDDAGKGAKAPSPEPGK